MDDLLREFTYKCNELLFITNGYDGLLHGTPVKKAIDEQDRFLAIINKFSNETTIKEDLIRSRQAFLDNRHIFRGMIHSLYTQAWSTFQDNIFERIIEQHFSGVKIYKIPHIQIQFISVEDTPDKLLQNIKYRVSQSAYQTYFARFGRQGKFESVMYQ